MPRFTYCFALVLALHVGAGWLLRDMQDKAFGVAVQAPQAMRIQLVDPEPAPAPVLVPASRSAVNTKRSQPARPSPPVRPSVVTNRPWPTPSRPAARSEPARDEPRAQAKPQAMASTKAEPTRAELPVVASSLPEPASPQVTEVFSREPSFLTPPKPPVYPALARRRNQQGLVLVEVRLDAQGLLQGIRLLRSSGVESLDRSALDAVAAWRFRPETRNGRPVASRVRIPIEFALSASR